MTFNLYDIKKMIESVEDSIELSSNSSTKQNLKKAHTFLSDILSTGMKEIVSK